MKRMVLAAVAALSVLASSAASAGTGPNHSISTKMTYTTLDAVKAAVTSAYSGVGSVFTLNYSSLKTGYGSLCTGSLLNSTTVITAAHCMYDHDETTGKYDPVIAAYFILPSYGELDAGASGVEVYGASAYAYNPLFDNQTDLDFFPAHTGNYVGGNDVAVMTLGAAATGYDTYSIYTGDPLQQYTEVGTGTIGGPAGTDVGVDDDYEKRTGSNIFELYGSDIYGKDSSMGVVMSDFDDGTSAHDVFGRNKGLPQLGVDGEADSSPGDSGGPEFINGAIASVTSFGDSGGIFDGYCGADSTDPYNEDGGTAKTSLEYCTNSSVGEIAGDTLTAYNLDFIDAYLAGTAATHALPFLPAVPEPGSWALLLLGSGMIGSALRRRAAPRAATI